MKMNRNFLSKSPTNSCFSSTYEDKEIKESLGDQS